MINQNKHMPHKSNGKVAHLPRAARDKVNFLLDDGNTYTEVIDWLSSNGFPDFNHENIRQWHNRGFQDWLKRQDQLSDHEKLRELAVDVARQSEGSKIQEAALHIGAGLIFQTLLKFDPDKLAERLGIKPEHFSTLMNSFTRLNRRSSELDMVKEYIRQEDERRQKELERKQNPGEPKGLSDEAGDAMERRLNLT
jgi:hypothetical protein